MDEIVQIIEAAKSDPRSSANNGKVDAFNGRLKPAIANSGLECTRKCHTSPGCGFSDLESDADGSVLLEPRSENAKQKLLHAEQDVVEGKLASLRGLRSQQKADSCIDLDLRITFTQAYLETIEVKLTARKLWLANPLVCLM